MPYPYHAVLTKMTFTFVTMPTMTIPGIVGISSGVFIHGDPLEVFRVTFEKVRDGGGNETHTRTIALFGPTFVTTQATPFIFPQTFTFVGARNAITVSGSASHSVSDSGFALLFNPPSPHLIKLQRGDTGDFAVFNAIDARIEFDYIYHEQMGLRKLKDDFNALEAFWTPTGSPPAGWTRGVSAGALFFAGQAPTSGANTMGYEGTLNTVPTSHRGMAQSAFGQLFRVANDENRTLYFARNEGTGFETPAASSLAGCLPNLESLPDGRLELNIADRDGIRSLYESRNDGETWQLIS